MQFLVVSPFSPLKRFNFSTKHHKPFLTFSHWSHAALIIWPRQNGICSRVAGQCRRSKVGDATSWVKCCDMCAPAHENTKISSKHVQLCGLLRLKVMEASTSTILGCFGNVKPFHKSTLPVVWAIPVHIKYFHLFDQLFKWTLTH